jgi:hypothetical protein
VNRADGSGTGAVLCKERIEDHAVSKLPEAGPLLPACPRSFTHQGGMSAGERKGVAF